MLNKEFVADSRTNAFLTHLPVEFIFRDDIRPKQINPTWKTVNLARPRPIRDDAVEQYLTLREGGSPAPALILHDAGNETFDLLDGGQRMMVAELVDCQAIGAYIVAKKTPDDMLTAIRCLSNARLQGRSEPLDWTKRRAVEILMIQRHMPPEEVARIGGWRAAELVKIAHAMQWGFEIRRIGGPAQLADTMIHAIATATTQEELRTAPKPIADFLATLQKFSAEDAAPHLEEFFAPIAKASRKHQVYEERLEEFLNEPEVQIRLTGRKGPSLSRDVNLRRLLKGAAKVLDEMVAASDKPLYVDEFFKLVNDLRDKLHAIKNSRGRRKDNNAQAQRSTE